MKLTKLNLYQYAVIAFAVYLMSTLNFAAFFHPNTIWLLLLGILVEAVQIPVGRAYGSLIYGVVIGTLILLGPQVAAPLIILSLLIEPLFKKGHHRGWLLAIFNPAQYAISVFAAYFVYLQFGGVVGDPNGWLTTPKLLVLVPVVAAYMITNHLLVYALFYLRNDQLAPKDYFRLFTGDLVNVLISMPFAVFMLAFSHFLTIIFLTFLPLVLFAQVLKFNRRISQLNRVHEVTYNLQSEFDLETIYKQIVDATVTLASSAATVLWVIRGDKIYPVCLSDDSLRSQLPQDGLSLSDTGIVVNAVHNKKVEMINDVWKDRRVKSIKGKAHFESLLVVPLRSRDKVVGVLTCYGTRRYAFTEVETEILTVLATQVGVIIENANLYSELQEATLRDPGTGLYNYRYFYQELNRRFLQAKELQQPMSIVILDIDHFKKYNDTYGHVVGDEVLRQTAQVIQATVGQHGVVARYGGEEFAVLLDEGLETAKQSVERIRRSVAQHKFEYQGYTVQGVTISVGVATYPDHDHDEKELLEKADQAMYWGAKQRGRNKVAVYTPDFDAHLFVDQLTGLYTYHYLHIKMMEEFTSAQREVQQQFALFFLNVIEFDSINRTFGFEIGNHILREISMLIKQNVRQGEIASRYGGDEFLLLVPGVERMEAEKIRDRLVKAICTHPFRVRDNVIIRMRVRTDLIVFPDEVAEEHQLISQIPETFLHLSSEWAQAQTLAQQAATQSDM